MCDAQDTFSKLLFICYQEKERNQNTQNNDALYIYSLKRMNKQEIMRKKKLRYLFMKYKPDCKAGVGARDMDAP